MFVMAAKIKDFSLEKPYLIDAEPLREAVKDFCRERDWQPYHTPKNLMLALVGEVGELAEIFQWATDEECLAFRQDPAQWAHINEEIADVLIYLMSLSNTLGVDLDYAVRDKLIKNARKYPAPAGD